MAFRNRRKVRRFSQAAGRSYRRIKSASSGLKATDVLMAGAIYGVARPLVAKIIPDFFSFGPVDSDNVIVGTAAYFGMKKSKGILKALSAIALGGEAGIVTSRISSGLVNQQSTTEDSYTY